MTTLGNVVTVAQQMLEKLGRGAPEILERRAEAHAQEGDGEAAGYWRRVASAVRYLNLLSDDYLMPGKPIRAFRLADVELRRAFQQAPQPCLLLQPNLIIVGANDAYRRATMTETADIVTRRVFDVFPDNPAIDGQSGTALLGASFGRVLDTSKPDRLPAYRHDIRAEQGQFEEHWWETTNTPVLDEAGRVTLIMHQIEDVTARVRFAAGTAAVN